MVPAMTLGPPRTSVRPWFPVSAAQMVGAVEGDNPHLWFSSDARNAMAKELADTYSRIMPAQKKYFNNKLTAWNRREKKIEKDMKGVQRLA